jgi:hypothetical protein
MNLPREDDLAKTYLSASDNELLDLALTYDSLTEVAQNALRAEFAHRGLEPPVIPDPAPDAELLPVVTVQQYRDLTEAQLAMGVLESAGIPCYLRDENTVRMDWFYFKICWAASDFRCAKRIVPRPKRCSISPSLSRLQLTTKLRRTSPVGPSAPVWRYGSTLRMTPRPVLKRVNFGPTQLLNWSLGGIHEPPISKGLRR